MELEQQDTVSVEHEAVGDKFNPMSLLLPAGSQDFVSDPSID